MIPPNNARIGGVICEGLSHNEYRLVEALLIDISEKKRSVEIEDVMEHVYGDSTNKSDNALKQVIKRLIGDNYPSPLASIILPH